MRTLASDGGFMPALGSSGPIVDFTGSRLSATAGTIRGVLRGIRSDYS